MVKREGIGIGHDVMSSSLDVFFDGIELSKVKGLFNRWIDPFIGIRARWGSIRVMCQAMW